MYLSAVSQHHQAVLLACSTHCSGDRGHAPGSLNEEINKILYDQNIKEMIHGKLGH